MDGETGYSTINWIKAEVEGSLDQARQALEASMEHPRDIAQMRLCERYLRQARAALQMVELNGAALLVEEMERLLGLIVEDEDRRQPGVYEFLVRAMLVVANYLEWINGGHDDLPLALISPINEARALRGAEALAERSLFAPDLSVMPAYLALAQDANEARVRAQHIRPLYQSALVAWLRQRDEHASLSRIGQALTQLEQAATLPDTARLWWVLGGIVEALLDRGLEPTLPLKQVFGQVDRLIKALGESGEQALARLISDDLLSNVLYHVGKARSRGERVVALKGAFRLEAALPSDPLLQEIRQGLGAPTAKLWESVLPALLEDIAKIKDALDVLSRQDETGRGALEPIERGLQRLADTLELLGLDHVRELMLDQVHHVHSLMAPQQGLDIAALGALAKELLCAERMLKRAVETGGGGPSQGEDALEDAELSATVLQAAKADMFQVIESIDAFTRVPEQSEQLDRLPSLFKRMVGALSMLSFTRAAGLIEVCGRYVTHALIGKHELPHPASMDALAVALAGLEQYLHALEENHADRQSLLDTVQQSLDDLLQPQIDVSGSDESAPSEGSYTAVDPLADETQLDLSIGDEMSLPPTEVTAHALSQPYEAPAQESEANPDHGAVILDLDSDVGSVGTRLGIIEVEPVQEQEDAAGDTPEHDTEILGPFQPTAGLTIVPGTTALKMQGEYQQAAEAVTVGAGATAEDIDPDLVEVFLEEAQEQLTSIAHDIPAWRAQGGDAETLGRLRRSFHTLKGSGRLVGARTLGEFAWAYEDMLNRVIDGALVPGPPLFAALERAPDALRRLIDELRAGVVPNAEPLDSGAAGLIGEVQAICHLAEGSAQAIGTPQAGEEVGERAEYAEIGPMAEAPVVQLGSADTPEAPVAVAEATGSPVPESQSPGLPPSNVPVMETVPDDISAGVSVSELGVGYTQPVEPIAKSGSRDEPYVALPAQGESASRWEAGMHDEPARAAENPIPVMRVRDEIATERTSLLEADNELAQIFFQEAADLLDANEVTLHHWVQEPENAHWRGELQRALHTLKGSARMAGVKAMGDLSHSLESLLVAAVDGRLAVSQTLFELMQAGNDTLVGMLEEVRNGHAVLRATPLMDRIEALLTRPAVAVDLHVTELPQQAPTEPVEAARESETVHLSLAEAASEQAAAPAGGDRPQYEQVRVRASLLDGLVNFAAEVSIYHARLKQQVHTFHAAIDEFAQTTTRMQDQLRRMSIETEAQMLFRHQDTVGQEHAIFDPLEFDRYTLIQQLSRSMLESVSDLANIRGLLNNVTRDSEMLLIQQGRVHTELQEGLMRTRMLPFAVLVPRLRRVVRQVSSELGKTVDLHIEGEESELDRTVLDKIAAPLEHMLRNAVSHGLEAPEARQEKGKPAAGRILIRLRKEGAEVVLEVCDDGAGIDLSAVRRKAVERGLMADDAALSDRELMHFILESGFSTAARVSQVSGRGVGMDVVDRVVKQLGGTLSITSERGTGTGFTIRLPLMLSITQALVVRLGDEIYAIPLAHIRAVLQMRQAELDRYYAAQVARVDYGGDSYQLISLGELIDSPRGELRAPDEKVPLLILASGDLRVALQVDGLLGRREIVVKSLGLQLSSVKGLLGATILGDGRVALILDTATLARKAVGQSRASTWQRGAPLAEGSDKAITVMVVDDSITIRKVTARLLERHRMRVLTAKDGVDALEQLQSQVPDIAVLDIEMPRMDGFELARHIRHSPEFNHIPIIMITSRIGDKHRQHAGQIGVDRYLGKPYQETELLDSIHELLQQRR